METGSIVVVMLCQEKLASIYYYLFNDMKFSFLIDCLFEIKLNKSVSWFQFIAKVSGTIMCGIFCDVNYIKMFKYACLKKKVMFRESVCYCIHGMKCFRQYSFTIHVWVLVTKSPWLLELDTISNIFFFHWRSVEDS